MKIYQIEKDYGSHDCWGRYEDNWVRTNIVFTSEEEAKGYVNLYGSNYYRYATIETK